MRPAIPLLIVLALVAAGCLQDGPPPLGPGSDDALAFEAPIRLPGDVISAEPNVEADGEGTVWVVGVGAAATQANVLRGQGNLWRSQDHGATWEALRLKQDDPSGQGHFCSCDTDIALGVDGRLYMTDFWVLGTAVGVSANGFNVEWSDDEGDTWPGSTPVTISRPVQNDRQYITAGDEDREVYLSYASFQPAPTPTEDSGIFVWRSDDGGDTFLPVGQAAANDAQQRAQLIGKMRAAEDGTLWLPYVWVTGDVWYTEAEAVVARSDDEGATWTEVATWPVPGGPGGLWPMAMDVGGDGVLHAVWMEHVEEGGSDLWYTHSTDGEDWERPQRIGWEAGTAVLPWIAATDDGRAVVAFYGNPEPMDPLEADPDVPWHAYALLVDGGGAGGGQPVQVSPWPVKVGRFCPQGASCAEDRELLDYPGVEVAGGWVHLAFAASTLDEGAGPPEVSTSVAPVAVPAQGKAPTGGHSTAARMWVARAPLG